MLIPEDKIAEIQNTADIVDVVSEVVLLKQNGKNYLGLCPFHTEKTPSFTVSPDKQIFYCFGCGVGGNVFSFLMKREGASFPEAVRQLADRYGIVLPTPNLSPAQKKATHGKRSPAEHQPPGHGVFRANPARCVDRPEGLGLLAAAGDHA